MISLNTARTHISRIHRKMNVLHNQQELLGRLKGRKKRSPKCAPGAKPRPKVTTPYYRDDAPAGLSRLMKALSERVRFFSMSLTKSMSPK